jgi:FAD:protein FMN transferase
MASQRTLAWRPRAPFAEAVSRRRFLQGVGLLAGAATIGPALGALAPRQKTRIDETRAKLGTWVRVVARHHDDTVASRAVALAFAAVDRVDDEMSIHRADSKLAAVNGRSGAFETRVPESVLEVVAMAREGARRTAGVYDPTVLPLLRLYGFYGPPRDRVPTDREIARAMEAVGWQDVALDWSGRTLGLERRGAALDLGSIGKGWAVDRAVQALRETGIRDGLVDAGGNVYAFGSSEDGEPGWSVGVYHPVTRAVDRVFTLREQGIATSGNYEQYRVLGSVRVGHLFDARRGRPADGHLSSTVLAKNATQADLMSTVSFLLGPDRFDWPEAQAVHFIG